ncbi:c-type cytochrome [Brevundimonas sp. TWP2-3-4b1]|uniref:c-type cytochrome n=1 Tax=Brevundimonas sp. TWP2-3-4b1 TaxID=2804580 RepID=UPI003CF046A6
MKRLIVAGAVALMCAGGAAGAQEDAMSPAQIVAARQASLMMSGVTMGSIKAGLDAGAPAQSMGFSSGALTRWATALPNMFPAGTGSDTLGAATKARPEIWTDRAGFEARAGDYAAAAARLQELIAAGDTAGAQAQFMVVRASCQSCHDTYRS